MGLGGMCPHRSAPAAVSQKITCFIVCFVIVPNLFKYYELRLYFRIRQWVLHSNWSQQTYPWGGLKWKYLATVELGNLPSLSHWNVGMFEAFSVGIQRQEMLHLKVNIKQFTLHSVIWNFFSIIINDFTDFDQVSTSDMLISNWLSSICPFQPGL